MDNEDTDDSGVRVLALNFGESPAEYPCKCCLCPLLLGLPNWPGPENTRLLCKCKDSEPGDEIEFRECMLCIGIDGDCRRCGELAV